MAKSNRSRAASNQPLLTGRLSKTAWRISASYNRATRHAVRDQLRGDLFARHEVAIDMRERPERVRGDIGDDTVERNPQLAGAGPFDCQVARDRESAAGQVDAARQPRRELNHVGPRQQIAEEASREGDLKDCKSLRENSNLRSRHETKASHKA